MTTAVATAPRKASAGNHPDLAKIQKRMSEFEELGRKILKKKREVTQQAATADSEKATLKRMEEELEALQGEIDALAIGNESGQLFPSALDTNKNGNGEAHADPLNSERRAKGEKRLDGAIKTGLGMAGESDEWKKVPLKDLGIKGKLKETLEAVGIKTHGELADAFTSNKILGIRGISEGSRSKLNDFMASWWDKNPPEKAPTNGALLNASPFLPDTAEDIYNISGTEKKNPRQLMIGICQREVGTWGSKHLATFANSGRCEQLEFDGSFATRGEAIVSACYRIETFIKDSKSGGFFNSRANTHAATTLEDIATLKKKLAQDANEAASPKEFDATEPRTAVRGASLDRVRVQIGDMTEKHIIDAGWDYSVSLCFQFFRAVTGEKEAEKALKDANLGQLTDWAEKIKALSRDEVVKALQGIEPK